MFSHPSPIHTSLVLHHQQNHIFATSCHPRQNCTLECHHDIACHFCTLLRVLSHTGTCSVFTAFATHTHLLWLTIPCLPYTMLTKHIMGVCWDGNVSKPLLPVPAVLLLHTICPLCVTGGANTFSSVNTSSRSSSSH